MTGLALKLLQYAMENASMGGVSSGAIGSLAKPLIREEIAPQDRTKLLSDWRVQRGLKVPANAIVWRGVSDESGSGMATYGQGLYTTLSRKIASQYGNAIQMPRDSLPYNPLRFKTHNDYEIWRQQAMKALGFNNPHDFVQKYYDVSEWVREIEPTADGIQISTGRDAIFVKWPE